jgi:phosphate starvation-inducible PhoH-like protein
MDIAEKIIKLDSNDMLSLLGYNDKYLQLIENKFQAMITVRGDNLILKGSPDEIKMIETVFKELTYMLNRNGSININDVSTVLEILETGTKVAPDSSVDSETVIYYGVRDVIRARNSKQQEYLQQVNRNDVVFSIGPAGTGKTFLAVAMALDALKKNRVSRIILSRPAVEAGESLGFLPGDLKEKLDPYLKPLTDALFYMLPSDKLKSMMEKELIEIIPLAYMRGRTLNSSFVILDEAQNATIAQMKMFLTRLGQHSKAIVTGDVTQVDLLNKDSSGLIHAYNLLSKVKGIGFVEFGNKHIVRHRLVAEILKAYEKHEKQHKHKKLEDGKVK